MFKIYQFPEDHHFWLVKWIDGFRLPHKATRSASVCVYLQRLPYKSAHEVQEISKYEAQSIVGHSSSYKSSPPPTLELRVHASVLALLTVGDIYHQQECVGRLPSTITTLHIRDMDHDLATIQLKDQLLPPPGWHTEMPYCLLNPFEYFGVKQKFNSYCTTVQHNNIQFIIPDTIIFRCFYGPTHELIKAFLHGPWPMQLKNVIYTGETESGLKTQVSPEGHWDLVLTEKIKFDYAFHIAPLYFDDYGNECAQSIYSHALKSRNGKINNVWYCRATIPYRTTNTPLKIKLSGFFLKSRGGPYKNAAPRKFLATKILSSDLPDYIPKIRIERTNSGERSKEGNITPVDLPPPFYSARKTKPANSETTIDSDYDSHLDYVGTDITDDSFNWTNKPELEKLEKQSSKVYAGARTPKPNTINLDRTSAGESSYQEANLPSANIQTIIREPNKRFSYLLLALKMLAQSGDIQGYRPYPPHHPMQIEKRAGLICWNLLDSYDLLIGSKPRHGWRVLETKQIPHTSSPIPIPRCVLVLEITLEGKKGLWFEIESKENEAGFYSPFLLGSMDNPNELINDVLAVISSNLGRNLKEHLVHISGEYDITGANFYKHIYENRHTGKLSISSFRKFFQKVKQDLAHPLYTM